MAAFVQEVYVVKAMLDVSYADVERIRSTDDDLHPWLAVAANGVERFQKLFLGLARHEQTGAWPGGEIRTESHRIVSTEAKCRQLVQNQLERATHPKWIRRTLDDVESDRWLQGMLELFEDYANQGRYENLNVLAGKPMGTPLSKFQALENDNMKSFAPPLGRGEPSLDDLVEHRDRELRRTLLRWRNLYSYAMAHEVIGPLAKRFGLVFVVR